MPDLQNPSKVMEEQQLEPITDIGMVSKKKAPAHYYVTAGVAGFLALQQRQAIPQHQEGKLGQPYSAALGNMPRCCTNNRWLRRRPVEGRHIQIQGHTLSLFHPRLLR
ncbi:hypothetical protein SRHO_G00333640 [Serrasalmus rhombeus]